MADPLVNMFGTSGTTFTPYRDEDAPDYATNPTRDVMTSAAWNRMGAVLGTLEDGALALVRADTSLMAACGAIAVMVAADAGTQSTASYDTAALSPADCGIGTDAQALFGGVPFAPSHTDSRLGTVPHVLLAAARYTSAAVPSETTGSPPRSVPVVPTVEAIPCFVTSPGNQIQIRLVNPGGRIPAGTYVISILVASVDALADVL